MADGAPTTSASEAGRQKSAWKVEVRWRGRLVEVLTADARGRLDRRLPSGARIRVRRRRGRCSATVGGERVELVPGRALEAGGLSLTLLDEEPAPRAWRLPELDSHWLHAVMLAAAVQVCGVAALLLAPPPVDDPGGGFPVEELKRYLRAPAGDAPHEGEGTVVRVGRPAQEAERPRPTPAPSGHPSVTASPARPLSLAEALAALDRAVQGGTELGVELKQTIGDLARSTATAPTTGAGMGGLLAPRDQVDLGAGSGAVGVGTSRIREELERHRRLKEAPPPPVRRRAARPVSTPDETSPSSGVDEAEPEPQEAPALDPLVRDQLAKAIRRRQSNIRYCYETWGLTQDDPRRSGRVVLELTLGKDGYVSGVEVSSTDRGLALVGDCIERLVQDWYLGGGLVDGDTRLAFPFILQPRVHRIEADEHEVIAR